jgi:hypothetical protein
MPDQQQRAAADVAPYQRALLSSGHAGQAGLRHPQGVAGSTGSRATCCATWWTTTARGSGQPQRQQTLLTAREQEIVRHLMTGPQHRDRRQPVRERTHRQIPSLQRLQEAERQEPVAGGELGQEYL